MEDNLDVVQYFIDLFIGMLVCGLVGALIGRSRGRPIDGLGWGILLGPLGWLIVALLSDKRPKCPYCRGAVELSASRCRHCGGELRSGRSTPPTTTTLSGSNVKYYYTSNGEQQGPIDASDLRMMHKDGLINDDTPVIREGESDWRQYRDYLALNR